VCGTAVESSGDRGVHVGRHQAAKAAIFRVRRIDVIPVDYAGNAFHIARDQNIQDTLPST
jgi:hypothetical protein